MRFKKRLGDPLEKTANKKEIVLNSKEDSTLRLVRWAHILDVVWVVSSVTQSIGRVTYLGRRLSQRRKVVKLRGISSKRYKTTPLSPRHSPFGYSFEGTPRRTPQRKRIRMPKMFARHIHKLPSEQFSKLMLNREIISFVGDIFRFAQISVRVGFKCGGAAS